MTHYEIDLNKNGDIIEKYINMIISDLDQSDKNLKPFVEKLKIYIEKLNIFSKWMKEKIKSSKDDANAASNDYLKVLGYVAVGYSWLKVLEVSYKDYSNNKVFYEDKIQTANFYFNRVLPRVESHYLSATTGSKYIMDFKFN